MHGALVGKKSTRAGTIRVVEAQVTVDIGDNLLPSLTVFGCSRTAAEVETGPLSDVVFPSFILPSFFSFPWYCALYDLFAEATLSDHMAEPS